MEDLPLGRIAALEPEFAVKDLSLGRILMMMILAILNNMTFCKENNLEKPPSTYRVFGNSYYKLLGLVEGTE